MRSRQLRPGRYSPFASSTERSLVERFAVLVPSALLRATTALPFVISTEEQRSGEICGPRSLCSTPGHDGPPLCHLDRSAAKWRDLRSSFALLYSGPRRPSPLSSRPKRSEVERSAVLVRSALLRATTTLPVVISTEAQRSGEICGPRSLYSAPGHDDPPLCHLDRSAAKWRDLRSSFPLLCSGPRRPSPLSSRPKRSEVERSAVLVPSTLLRATTTLPFVISTEAQRSGEICGPRSLYSAPGHDDPPLCHLDRSAAKWRDLRSSFPLLCSGPRRPSPLSSRPKRSEVERSAVLVPSTLLRATTTLPFVISTEAQRSGEICGPRSLYSAPGHDDPPLCHLDR